MSINDFGEKIGGAKKDLWKETGLGIDDLVNMNTDEKYKFITKDNVWKKPNYQKIVDEGLPIRVAYFIKQIRDATLVKPNIRLTYNAEEISQAQEGYIEFVSDLKNAVMSLKSEDDVLNFYKDYLSKYIIRNGNSHFVEISPLANNCIDNKLLKAAQVYNFYNIDVNIRKKQFCYTDEQKILSQYEIIKLENGMYEFSKDYSGKEVLGIKGNFIRRYIYLNDEYKEPKTWLDNSFFIMKDGKIIKNNLVNESEAKKYILDNHLEEKSKSQKTRRKNFVPRQLEDIVRNGEDYRKGKNITGENMLEEFDFKGGEFGNWLSENDRQASLNYCYDALKDLSKTLGISEKDISLNNTLSIAFGSRGAGTSPVAHYEEMREVINLTKMKGAGSLAHEWGHALDNAIGKNMGLNGFVTDKYNALHTEVKKLIETMKYKIVSDENTLKMQNEKYNNEVTRLKNILNSYFPEEHLNDENLKKKNQMIQDIIDKSEARKNNK